MSNLLRVWLIVPMLVLAGLLAPALFAQDEDDPDGFKPDPTQPITVDFVQKDLHTVMHYIALRSGLQIIVEGEVDVKLTVMFRKIDPKAAIQSICKANKLDYIEDGTVIIIKQRPQEESLANVVKGEREPKPGEPERFNVSFESHELVSAIMEVAKVTKTQVLIPALQQPEDSGDTPQRSEEEQQQEERVQKIQERLISMHMREALPSQILEYLAVLGDLEEPVAIAGTDSEGNPTVIYKFRYKLVRPDGIGVVDDGDVEILNDNWTIPGASMPSLKTELRDILSPYGSIVIDDNTDFIVVFDTKKSLDDIRIILDPLEAKAVEAKALADSSIDEFMVMEFVLTRDVAPAAATGQGGASGGAGAAGGAAQNLLAQLQSAVSSEGRVLVNAANNSVIVYELKSRMPNIEKIVRAMDMEPEQVLVTAKLIEVTLDEYMGYGLELFTSHSADNLNRGRFTGGSQDSSSGTIGGLYGQPTGFDPFFATFTNPRIDVRLELLANEGRVKTLSQPTQMVSNRAQAHIEVGQEIPYLESSSQSGGSAQATVSFKEVAISMDVTPTILEDGLMRIQVAVSVREVIGNIAIQNNNTPILSLRESSTNVFIRDGETLVMGGLMRERERTDENGLPFLKDIPFLGYLFKSANRSVNKTDLLFFLRPTIVSANGPGNERAGEGIERDLRPLVYEDQDAKDSAIRNGRFRKLEIAPKPTWYNDAARPKSARDVKPGQ